MDDPRIEWIRNKAYLALDIKDPEIFEQLLEREDGEGERDIAKFINDTPTEDSTSLLFYKVVREEEDEIEVECGMLKTLITPSHRAMCRSSVGSAIASTAI